MNKTVLITGASRGIGAAAAAEFAKQGYTIIAVYKNSKNLEKKQTIFYYQCDVSNSAEVEKLKQTVLHDFSSIDVIINNAGVAKQNLVTDVTDEEYDYIMNTNVKGMFNITRAFLPSLINKKHGKIINVSSMWGIAGASCESVYSASKGAVIAFTKAIAKEVGPCGIQVNCIAPGVIMTDMNSQLSKNDIEALCNETPLERTGTPQDIANLMLFLASEKADFITGQIISSNGGFII